jgi:hypothetical protein
MKKEVAMHNVRHQLRLTTFCLPCTCLQLFINTSQPVFESTQFLPSSQHNLGFLDLFLGVWLAPSTFVTVDFDKHNNFFRSFAPETASMIDFLFFVFASLVSATTYRLTVFAPDTVVDGAVINAAGNGFYLGLSEPLTYCPVADLCPATRGTLVYEGMTAMAVS